MSKKHVKKQGVANKPLQRTPEASQNDPKTYQDPTYTSRDAPRWTQDGAKIPPRGRQMPPKRRLTPPRRSQDASKMTLGRPNPPPRHPKNPLDPPKMTLMLPQRHPFGVNLVGFLFVPFPGINRTPSFLASGLQSASVGCAKRKQYAGVPSPMRVIKRP